MPPVWDCLASLAPRTTPGRFPGHPPHAFWGRRPHVRRTVIAHGLLICEQAASHALPALFIFGTRNQTPEALPFFLPPPPCPPRDTPLYQACTLVGQDYGTRQFKNSSPPLPPSCFPSPPSFSRCPTRFSLGSLLSRSRLLLDPSCGCLVMVVVAVVVDAE